MKVQVAGVLAATALACGSGIVGTAPAHAVPGCVTHHEFLSITKGMSRHHVERVFGDHESWPASGGAGGYVLSYQSCDYHHAAFVEYAVKVVQGHGTGAYFDGFRRWTQAG